MFTQIVSLALVAAPAAAHLGFWHPSMYGFDNYLSAYPMGYPNFVPFDQWWFHGMKNEPPADGQFFELPAGGQAQAQVACNKQFTTWGGYQGTPDNACPSDFNSLHEGFAENTKGCAIAIAYKSDVNAVQPEDFVVISVNHACPWNRDVTFDIPAGLPECPEGGCHCMWGWIHGESHGGDEMYMNGFKCKVTNPGNKALATPKSPVRCSKGDCSGPKNPLYFSQVERANVVYDQGPPSYNDNYGWPNGAQNDIFGDGTSNPRPTSATPTSTATGWTPTATDSEGSNDWCEDEEWCDDETSASETSTSTSWEETSTTTAPEQTSSAAEPASSGHYGDKAPGYGDGGRWGGGRNHKHGRPDRWNGWKGWNVRRNVVFSREVN